ncbi:MAG TPA: 50S ribosomal protein L31, partial [Nitrospinae bacterium]|nr:50S ribosomal protein L31 [Nitrospinota bacterium]
MWSEPGPIFGIREFAEVSGGHAWVRDASGWKEPHSMKADIHPELYETTVVCSGCQTEFKTHSTRESFRIEICSNCHPFYTGKQSRIIDTEGRVEKFVKKFQDQQTRVSKRKRRIATRVAETAAQEEREKQKAIDEKTAREEARIRRREEQVALRATREAEEKTVADSRAAQVAAPETE